MPNRLAHEASPYLQQHANNPVDWFPWGQEALERAKREDKPILLSIGYSACHWCHVMEKESFENARIAGLMNEHFVSVKVDREERPDLDQIYQLVVQLLGRSGGWPLTVFLTPEQKPFFGGTYFPPEDRYGLSGFPRILGAVAEAYRERRGDIDLQAKEILEAITQVASPSSEPGEVRTSSLAKAAARVSARFDDEHGGFGSRPKFPSTMSLDVLLHHGIANDDERALGRVRKALDAMHAGGIYDQLGGGFHRYSTDERWLVPHFEKMLYDNALLLRLYVDGYRIWSDEDHAATARDIARYLFREMESASGGFFATQDADSEGVEGKFFVWTPEEVKAITKDDAELVMARFGVTPEGNFEETGATVLHLAQPIAALAVRFHLAPSEIETRLERARAAMYAHREKRIHPFRDEKILTSWNGLVIGALADAGRALGEDTWIAAAAKAFDFLQNHLALRSGDDLTLSRMAKDGVAKGTGFLDDYAFVGCAAVDLYEATGRDSYLEFATSLARTIRTRFIEGERMWFTPKDGESLIARMQDVYDHAVPSATAMAIQLLLRTGAMVDETLFQLAERELGHLAAMAESNPLGLSGTVIALDRLARGSTDVVLVGDDLGASALLSTMARHYVLHRNVVWSHAGKSGATRLAEGKSAQATTVAYVCRNRTCSLPTADHAKLAELLSPPRNAVTT